MIRMRQPGFAVYPAIAAYGDWVSLLHFLPCTDKYAAKMAIVGVKTCRMLYFNIRPPIWIVVKCGNYFPVLIGGYRHLLAPKINAGMIPLPPAIAFNAVGA